MRRQLIGAVLAGVALVAARSAAAQRQIESAGKTVVVAGVADARTGAPIVGAEVSLPALNRSGRADWIGEVRISDVPAGAQTVTVRALGYASSSIVIPVSGDSVGAVFMLEPTAANMDTVKVTAASTPTFLRDFEMRRRVGFGQFLTYSVLSQEGERGLATVLAAHLHGLRVEPELPTTSAFLTVVGSGVSVDDHGVATAGTLDCPVDIYVDGQRLIDHLEAIATRDIGGVELYDFALAPAQYRMAASLGKDRARAACKVLLIWTKPY